METGKRLDIVVDYIATQFSCGWKSISRRDEFGDAGRPLYDEVSEIVRLSRAENLLVDTESLTVEALQTMLDTWDSGYDLAAGDDFIDDDFNTVREVILDHDYEDTFFDKPISA